ncbi:YoaK family protein [Catellatospora sichuanensis]|uniref:YoaK family protein n=1 Tax=Catellatospora sichuanensis TaxID=1969805 RepID=UPI001183D49F|nr:YoaK family protein [Catellatospora sichuanensis]
MAESGGVPYRTSRSLRLIVLLTMAAGFLDAYTFLGRGGVFATAQTGNVVLLGVQAAQAQWAEALRHVPPIIAFVVGVWVAETIRQPRVAVALRKPARAALVLEILVLVVVGVLPSGVSDDLVAVMIAFVASVQITSFGLIGRWSFNTTVTTTNLRNAAQALYGAAVRRDRDAAAQARSLWPAIVSFAVGALLGGLVTARVGDRAVWVATGLLLAGLALFLADDRRRGIA